MGGGWALEIESFLGPVKCHRADRRVPFQKHKTWLLGEQDGLGASRAARRRQRFLLAPRKLNPVPGRDTPGKILNTIRRANINNS